MSASYYRRMSALFLRHSTSAPDAPTTAGMAQAAGSFAIAAELATLREWLEKREPEAIVMPSMTPEQAAEFRRAFADLPR